MCFPIEELQRQQRQEKIRTYLDHLAGIGARIAVEGLMLSTDEMARVMAVSEGFCFMPDFKTDKQEKLFEIRFNRVILDGKVNC